MTKIHYETIIDFIKLSRLDKALKALENIGLQNKDNDFLLRVRLLESQINRLLRDANEGKTTYEEINRPQNKITLAIQSLTDEAQNLGYFLDKNTNTSRNIDVIKQKPYWILIFCLIISLSIVTVFAFQKIYVEKIEAPITIPTSTDTINSKNKETVKRELPNLPKAKQNNKNFTKVNSQKEPLTEKQVEKVNVTHVSLIFQCEKQNIRNLANASRTNR